MTKKKYPQFYWNKKNNFSGQILLKWPPISGQYTINVIIQFKEMFGQENMDLIISGEPTQHGSHQCKITNKVEY